MSQSRGTGARHDAALALGANLGDRLVALQNAVDGLAAAGEQVVAVSGVHETDPVGPPGQPDYLNAVVVVRTLRTPEELLALAHELESAAGRVRDQRWGPRTLDVDVLSYDDLQRAAPDPVLPHPRCGERAFVLIPWAEADPRAWAPGIGAVADLVMAVDCSGVRARPDLRLAMTP